MRYTDVPTGVPAPEHDADLGTVAAVAAAFTLVLIATFVVATYPVLLGAAVPMMAVTVAR